MCRREEEAAALHRDAILLQKQLEGQKAEHVRQQGMAAERHATGDMELRERQDRMSLHETKIQQRIASLKKQEEILVCSAASAGVKVFDAHETPWMRATHAACCVQAAFVGCVTWCPSLFESALCMSQGACAQNPFKTDCADHMYL